MVWRGGVEPPTLGYGVSPSVAWHSDISVYAAVSLHPRGTIISIAIIYMTQFLFLLLLRCLALWFMSVALFVSDLFESARL